jgi:outer membrane protein TolC
VLLCLPAGCPPSAYRQQVDARAYESIRQKQLAALGEAEPFTIARPADLLRRQLLLDQELPIADDASLGTAAVEPIPQWPDDEYLEAGEGDGFAAQFDSGAGPLITLGAALQIAAHESREYQQQKEQVFLAALDLDFEQDAFRNTWAGLIEGGYVANLEEEVVLNAERGITDRQTVAGLEYGGVGELSRVFENGTAFTGQLGLDMVSLLTQDRVFSRGIFADVTITVPLLRGAGEFVVTEPLTQAERDVVYAIYDFERFKRVFAVDIASEYFAVLQSRDQVENAEENYKNLITSTRRARRLAAAGELPEIEVGQSVQDELRARDRWVSAVESYRRRVDAFKLTLGLPVDAGIRLDQAELQRLAEDLDYLLVNEGFAIGGAALEADPTTEGPQAGVPADAPVELIPPGAGAAGPLELEPLEAVLLALEHRLDLRIAIGRVFDSQRDVAVAADLLRADLTLLGTGSAGARRALATAGADDAILRPDEGSYAALLTIDMPFERTAEALTYRETLVGFEQSIRDLQEREDQVKLAVLNRLSELLQARESMQIQARAVAVAERRVASTRMFLEAGRAEIRDLLEAQEALISAQNALTAALVTYRVGELALQRDLGLLRVDQRGVWTEYEPAGIEEQS